MASELKLLDGYLELCGLLRAGLETAAREVGRNMELQGRMAEELSSHVMSLASEPDRGGDHVAGMISALQRDDLVRQRQEAVTRLLAGMVAAIEDMTRSAARDLESGEVTVTEVRRRWVRVISESQNLAEIRDGLLEDLGSGGSGAAA